LSGLPSQRASFWTTKDAKDAARVIALSRQNQELARRVEHLEYKLKVAKEVAPEEPPEKKRKLKEADKTVQASKQPIKAEDGKRARAAAKRAEEAKIKEAKKAAREEKEKKAKAADEEAQKKLRVAQKEAKEAKAERERLAAAASSDEETAAKAADSEEEAGGLGEELRGISDLVSFL
jgi:hypothetical protein